MKLKTILAGSAAAAAAITAAGLPYNKIDTTYYRLSSGKIKNDMRIIVLADLHDQDYGENMGKLTEKIHPLKPDLILLPGDLCEEKKNDEHSFCLIDQLKQYPMIYSTGNHEEHRPDLPTLLYKIRKMGVSIPEQRSDILDICGNALEIVALPCVKRESFYDPAEVNGRFRTEAFRILMSHRPNWVGLYGQIDCDLIVSGHAHGGQWRCPPLHRGLVAPSVGLFPEYTEGIHDINGRKMLISRGLTKKTHGVIRLFNNPEIVVLDLTGEKENAEEVAA